VYYLTGSQDFRRDAYIWKHYPGPRLQRKILFDSGCDGGNWVSAAVVRALQADAYMYRLPEAKYFVAFNNQPTSADYEIKLSFTVEDGIYQDVYFLVSDDDPPFDMVLGKDDCLDFGILQEPSFTRPAPKPNIFGGLISRKQTKGKFPIQANFRRQVLIICDRGGEKTTREKLAAAVEGRGA